MNFKSLLMTWFKRAPVIVGLLCFVLRRLVRRAADRDRRIAAARSGLDPASPSSPSSSLLVLAFYLIRWWRRRRAAKALEKALKDSRGRIRRRRGAGRAHDRGARHAEAVERQADLPLRTALVHHHRPARRRQDHGAGQFRPEVPAGRRRTARPRSPASAARATATSGSPRTPC